MRIVLATPDLSGKSGWSRYARDLGKALVERGHEVHAIVAERSDTPWCTQHILLRQPTSYFDSSLLRWWHARRLTTLLRRLHPDIVHIIAEPYALLLPLLPGDAWKTVLTIHGTYATVPLLITKSARRLAEQYYASMEAIISVSAFTKNYLAQKEPALFASANLGQRIQVIHNAIDLAGVRAETQRTPGTPLRILSVSALKQKKGYLQAVAAVAVFLDKHQLSLQYDIVGSIAEREFHQALLRRIRELGLTDRVRFRGVLSDPELDTAYRDADLFLLPSLQEGEYFEGFGLVFLEANARGTPVIGPMTGGCPEAIQDGVSGYVCNPEDAAAIAARMEDVLVHGTIKRDDCQRWAEQHDIVHASGDIEELYARLFAGKSAT